ncbi:hypothetical protein [Massilia litorea]|uniref:Uncharacterized protein n=1 Tax=Massilia litorea TaxID=2769491 RepID=A0A7L9UDC8_9BURK|nr:hypothetical protein [Massilia litorea]QOL52232.1 hypothetical protein LPB04_23775 [Massilia litorea]
MLDIETLNFFEQEIEALLKQGSEESLQRAEEMAQMLEARIQEQRHMESGFVALANRDQDFLTRNHIFSS